VNLIQHECPPTCPSHSVSFTTARPPCSPRLHAATRHHPPPPTLGGGPLIYARRRMPPTPMLGGGRRSPLLTHPRSEEECSLSEEDIGHCRWCTRARKRSARPWLPLACPLMPPAEPLITVARSPLLLGRQVTAPPPGQLAPVREEL
jgi:hypothetical protein